MNIRFSIPSDRNAILRFIEEMYFTPRDASTWDALKMQAMLALEGDQIIGAIPFESRELFIGQNQSIKCAHETCVAIHPEFRNRGLGTKLQNALIQQTTDHDFLTVFREEPSSDSYRWYLKCGFTPVLEIESMSLDESLISPVTLAGPNDDFDSRK
ncbi:MAG TPA: GNAT family N-acetyltransferase, partial [Tepidisphaeraceae bacterium]|nr:GNAT family N-acetyltransferase [Tepidisphaeraceae bacterium]